MTARLYEVNPPYGANHRTVPANGTLPALGLDSCRGPQPACAGMRRHALPAQAVGCRRAPDPGVASAQLPYPSDRADERLVAGPR